MNLRPHVFEAIATAVVLLALVATAALAFGGCSFKSIDSVKEKKLDLCAKIRDEAVRSRCIQGVR